MMEKTAEDEILCHKCGRVVIKHPEKFCEGCKREQHSKPV